MIPDVLFKNNFLFYFWHFYAYTQQGIKNFFKKKFTKNT